MKCEHCDKDDTVLNILSIKQEDGRLNLIVCDDCAVKTGLYCIEHKAPHIGFEDGSSACRKCIEEKVAKEGKAILEQFQEDVLAAGVGSDKLAPIGRWQLAIKDMGFDPDVFLARAIVVVAERKKIETGEVIQNFIKEGPRAILPWLEDSGPVDFS